MGDLRIVTLTNRYPDFYLVMSPYLSRRSIVAELGYPVWDDDGKHWWIALRENEVVGFVGLRPESGKSTFTSDYVQPEHRKLGIYRRLFIERLNYAESLGLPIEATVTALAAPTFDANGFHLIRERGRYRIYRKENARVH